MNKSAFVEYSLGIEELALAFGLINRPDLGQQLLQSVYDTLSPQQVDERLASASHSLLARGVSSLSPSGSPLLDKAFEKALLPLVRFDRLFQLSLVIGDGQTSATIHVHDNKTFTAHLVNMGIVRVLTHGPARLLGAYLLNVFDEIGTEQQAGKQGESKPDIALGLLGKALRMSSTTKEMATLLTTESEWPEADAKALAEDIGGQILRGTILRIEANQDTKLEALEKSPKRSILLLKGKKRSWVFDFSNTVDTAQGKALVVDRPGFEKVIATLIA
ncbi:MAG: hypothetical protein QMD04_13530 [Anaerolineales bacterium]|nr:hypothetical protein [Anaerolineales bacterium]